MDEAVEQGKGDEGSEDKQISGLPTDVLFVPVNQTDRVDRVACTYMWRDATGDDGTLIFVPRLAQYPTVWTTLAT